MTRAKPRREGRWSALLLLAGVMFSGCDSEAPASRPDLACDDCSLVLISIDTLRADRLGAWGHDRPTSPNIDALARSGVRFANAYSVSYHTAESHMSMFTSLYPSVHGVTNANDAAAAKPLSKNLRTLPEQLESAGFLTAGFHGGGNVSRTYGFGRGFATYRVTLNDIQPAIDWLADPVSRAASRFFLFVHTYRPHDPYLPDPPFDELWYPEYQGRVFSNAAEFAKFVPENDFASKRRLFWEAVDRNRPEDISKLLALYDGEIRQVDEEIGRVLQAVRETGRRVLVVLVSDHGEEFQEHGRFLHDQLFEECLHVPFVIAHPDEAGSGSVIETRVSLIDLAPTILDLLGLPPMTDAQGESLAGLVSDQTSGPVRTILAEKVNGTDPETGSPTSINQALIAGQMKLNVVPGSKVHLHDLGTDPDELRPVESPAAAEFDRLRAALARKTELNAALRLRLRSGELPATTPLDAETIEGLRALGYLK